MTGFKDYYRILGVAPEASPEEIKKNYRVLAKQHHPDHNMGDLESENRLKEINEAYQVLSHEESKRSYDFFLHQRSGHLNFGGSEGPLDFMTLMQALGRGGRGPVSYTHLTLPTN